MNQAKRQNGLTLLELLAAITIFSIMAGGLYQVLNHTLAAYETTRNQQNLLSQARFAMERMVMFVEGSDEIASPTVTETQTLTVSERVLDTYVNETHDYEIDGDGRLDADNDADGMLNEGHGDPVEYVSFRLNTSTSDNWKLEERRPDYSTADTADTTQWTVICQHVTVFACRRLDAGMVEIQLALQSGDARVNLKTRAQAGHAK